MSNGQFGREFLVGTFDDERGLLVAAHALRAAGFRIYDAYTPYPLHALDALVCGRRSRLPWAALAGGVAGLISTFAFEVYAASIDWPLDVGGKPDNSALAFVPIAFELTILGSALAIAAAFFLRCGLFPTLRTRGAELEATGTAFALVLRFRDSGFDANLVRRLLHDHGATAVTRKAMDL